MDRIWTKLTHFVFQFLSAHTSHMETLYLLEEVLGAKFKFEKLSKQFGCYDESKFGFYEKVTGLKSAYC